MSIHAQQSFFEQSNVIVADLLEEGELHSSASEFNFSIDFAPRKTLAGKRVVSKYARYQNRFDEEDKVSHRVGGLRINTVA